MKPFQHIHKNVFVSVHIRVLTDQVGDVDDVVVDEDDDDTNEDGLFLFTFSNQPFYFIQAVSITNSLYVNINYRNEEITTLAI